MDENTPQETPAEPVEVAPDETKAPETPVDAAPDSAPEGDQVADDTPGVDDTAPSEDEEGSA